MMSLPVWLPSPMFLPGALYPRGFLSRGSLSRGVSVWGSLSGGSCLRDLCLRGLCPWDLYRDTPLESEKRVVRILLECFLVWQLFAEKLHVKVAGGRDRRIP